MRSIVVLEAIVLSYLFCAASSAQPSPATSTSKSFDELFRQAHHAAAAFTTLTARFTETTTSSLLSRPIVAHGILAVERPSRAVLRFTDPDPRVVLIDGNRMTMIWPSRNLRRVSNVESSQSRIQKYIETDSPAELLRQFDVDLSDRSEWPGTYEVTLIPKRKQVRDTLTRLDLWIGRSSFLLSAIRMTFANGDTKTMTFEDVAQNPTLDAGTFSVDR